MKCDKCGSDRIIQVNGKTSDLFDCQYKNKDYQGYVPKGIIIGDDGCYGDYIRFSFCLDCGKIQGNFPVSEEKVEAALSQEG